MATYRIGDHIVRTELSTAHWDEKLRFDGNNWVSVATGSQWHHEDLYRSRRGRYYLVHTCQWQGTTPYAEWISPQQATRWLLQNGHELPEELRQYEADVTE